MKIETRVLIDPESGRKWEIVLDGNEVISLKEIDERSRFTTCRV